MAERGFQPQIAIGPSENNCFSPIKKKHPLI
jgi:hypothetical protein